MDIIKVFSFKYNLIFGLKVFIITQMIMMTRCNGQYHALSVKKIKVSLPKDSFFGYSVTYQPKIRSLVISAPTADKIGQVFIYDIKLNNLTKMEFPFETEENNSTGYWLGADVKAGDSFFTTCAPRYEVKSGNRFGTQGQCFHKSFKKPQDIQMLKSMEENDQKWYGKNLEKAMDTLGWSIDITSNNNVLIGGPAMTKGRVVEYKDISTHPRLLVPLNNTKKEMFNFGYSIASGNYFSTNKNNLSYAISTPYGNEGIGQVHFYNENGEYISELVDNKLGLGTLFGASLCTMGFGHERASLIIGAPAFEPVDAHGVDLGAVHVYMSSDKSLTLKRTIRGQAFGGRFGSAIVNIGDLDGDHRDDVAIAAPYENDGNGAVYIYTSTNILSDKTDITYTQKLQSLTFKSFGLSLAVIKDYDDNGCNDSEKFGTIRFTSYSKGQLSSCIATIPLLNISIIRLCSNGTAVSYVGLERKELAVGAPYNNTAFILSCFSSVTINVFISVPNLQEKEGTEKGKLTVQTCLDVSFAEKPKIVKASILVDVSITHQSAKLEDSNSSTFVYTETLDRLKTIYCRDVVILTPLDKSNELYPIQINLKAQLKDDPQLSKDFNPDRVILTDRSILSDIKLKWISECNSRICVPELNTTIVSLIQSPYIIGSSNTENVFISITNTGETAYNPCLRIKISGARVLLASGCRRSSGETLICEPRNPLQTNQTWYTGDISLDTKTLTSVNNQMTVSVNTFDRCSNITNKKSTEMVIDLKPDLENLILTSEAIPGDIVNVSYVNLDTDVSHMYTITNKGVTNWADIRFQIVMNNPLAKMKTPILISTDGQTKECYPEIQTDPHVGTTATCEGGTIRKTQTVYIMVNLKIPPLSNDMFNVEKNVTIETMLQLMQNYEIKPARVSSTLIKILPPSLPLWIYLVTGLVAVLVLLILIIIFYEIGFLQRKNKVLLEDLKKDVRRQSVRRTMRLREDIRNSRIQRREDGSELLQDSGEATDMQTCSINDIE